MQVNMNVNTPHPTRPSSLCVFSKACTTTGAVFPPLACLYLILLYFKHTSIHYPFIPRFVVCLLEDIDLSGTTGPSLRPSCLRSRRLSSTSSVPRFHLLLHFGRTGGDPKVAINHWQLRDNLNPQKNRQLPVPTKMCFRDRSFKFHSNQVNMEHISKWPPSSGKIIFQTLLNRETLPLNHYVRRAMWCNCVKRISLFASSNHITCQNVAPWWVFP